MAFPPYEKVGSFTIFQPLFSHAEFQNYSPPLIGTPLTVMDVEEMAYPELLDHLKINRNLIHNWNLFEVDANGEYGFGTRVKNLFKSIAQNVRGFHKSWCYYGNLFQRVHVRIPQLIPIFPYHPQQASNQAQLVNGIKNDIENFRWMVSSLLLAGRVQLQKLSIDFDLFFSKIFTRAMGGDLEEIREFAVYQMFHPVFFDGEDRFRFFLQVMFYRSRIKKHNFDNDLNLHIYKVDEYWEKKIDNETKMDENREEKIDNDTEMDKSVLTAILKKTTSNNKGVDPYSVIPRFIRNVHIHYHDYYYHQEKIPDYDRMLNILFPGICSKIVDCIIRYVNDSHSNIVRFSTMLEQRPGFQSEEHRFSGLGGGGGSGGAGGGRGAGSGTGARSSSSGVGCYPYQTSSSSSGSGGQIPGGDGGGVAGSGHGVGHLTYHIGSSSSGSGGRPGGDGNGRGGRVADSGTGSNVSSVGRRTYHTGSRSRGNGGRTGGDGGRRGGSGGRTSGDGGGRGSSGGGSRCSDNRFAALSIESDEDK